MLTRHTRRQFIKRASAVSVGAWIATGAPIWSESRSANEKLDVGVVGANGRGRANVNAVGETENIIERRPVLAALLRLRGMLAVAAEAEGPDSRIQLDPEMERELRDLGYLQ